MEPRRIFVRAPNWVGDLVMATPSFARIRSGFAGAEIVCGLRPYLRPLLDGADFFDGYLDTPPARGPREILRQAAALRRRRFDLAIVLPNSLETGLVPFLAGVPRRVGYRQGRPLLMNVGLRAQGGRRLLHRRGPRRVPEPMPRYYARLLDLLGLPPVAERGILHVTAAQRDRIDAWLAERGVGDGERIVLLNAGASYGASKLWEPERFAAVARHFRARPGTTPILLAGPREVELVRPIAERSGAVAAIDPVLPLDLLKPLVERAGLMITTDTGPRHLAVAFDVPVVCLIGPTDPRYTDYCTDRTVLVRKDLECVPCQRTFCPLGHHQCMRAITVDEVVAAGERLLERFAGAPAPGPRR